MSRGITRRFAALCGAGILLAAICSSGAIAAETPEGEAPKIAIELTEVNRPTGILEVGLNGTTAGLRSAATVLCYDSTRIELLGWTEETPVVIDEKQNAWVSANPVRAVQVVDGIGARPALAYRDKTTVYLFLAVESVAPIAVDGRLATIRFRCIDDETGTKMAQLLAEPGAIGRSGSVISLAPKSVAEKVVSAAVQCTAVQDGAQIMFADTFFGEGEAQGTITTEWQAIKKGPSIVQQQNGAVTFVDWDGTILESAIVSGENDAKESLAAIMTDETLSVKAALASKLGYEFDCWLDVKACKARTDAPITANNMTLDRTVYKDCIVDGANLFDHLTGGSETGAVLQAAYKARRNAETGKYDPEFRPMIDEGKSPNYVFDYENIVYDRYGGVSENSGKYSVTIPISRIRVEDGKRYGVERAVQIGARISMQPKDEQRQAIFSYQALDGGDEITLEMVPTKDMEYVTFEVIDTINSNTWINARSRGGAVAYLQMKDVIPLATAHYVFRQARLEVDNDPSSEWDLYVDEQTFKDINGGGDVLNYEELKAKILAYVAGQTPPQPVNVALRSAALLAEPSKLSVEDELDFILGIIGAQTNQINCTIESYDEKKRIAVQVSVWNEGTASYVDYVSPAGKPIVDDIKLDADLGGGLCRQKLALSLKPGVYKMTITKTSHVPIEIVGFQVSTKKGESPDIEIAYADAKEQGNVTAFYIPCGDVTDDGRIRIDDYQAFLDSAELGKPAPPGSDEARYDLNGDGAITMADVEIITNPKNLGKGTLVFQIK